MRDPPLRAPRTRGDGGRPSRCSGTAVHFHDQIANRLHGTRNVECYRPTRDMQANIRDMAANACAVLLRILDRRRAEHAGQG
jgi:hypothetical protein